MAEMSLSVLAQMKEIAAKADPATLRRMAEKQRENAAMYERWAQAAEHKAAVWEDLATEREKEIDR